MLEEAPKPWFNTIGDKQKSFSSASLFDFSHLNEDVSRHLKRVYLLLLFTYVLFLRKVFLLFPLFFSFSSVLAASLGSYVANAVFSTESVAYMTLPLFLVSFGVILVLGFTPSRQDNAWWRSLLLVGFGFIQGVMVTPLIQSMAALDPVIPLKAFVLTCAVFASFSLAALVTRERKFLYLYGTCCSLLFGLLVLSLLNLFFRSPFLDNVWLYGGLLLFSVFVAVDTQMIIQRALQGNSDSVMSALDLFLDALNIFVRIMIILGRNKKNSNSNQSIV